MADAGLLRAPSTVFLSFQATGTDEFGISLVQSPQAQKRE